MTEQAQSRGPSKARHAIGGGLWTMMERGLSQAGQLLVFIAAARLLEPAEFGVFALVSASAILLLRVAEVGWAQYIMAWAGDAEIPRQVLFLAMLAGAVMGIIGALAGLGMGLLNLGENVPGLVILFSFWVFLASISAAQKGILIWQDKLRASAISEITGEVVGMAVAISALLLGFGVFALVFGRLAYQSTHLALSFSFTRMLPLTGLHGAQLREVITFSGQVFTGRMIINLRLYAGTFVIGGFLGPAAVGYYRAAERLVGALAEVLGVPTQVLAWSLFRKAREEHGGSTDGFQAQANLFFKVLVGIALPIFVWVAVMAEEIVTGLLGPQWLPALPIVAILALARVLMIPGFATEPILSLAGEIKRLPAVAVLFLVLTLVFALIAAPYGLYAVAWGQVAVSFVIGAMTFWMFERYGAIDWRDVMVRWVGILIAVALGGATLLVFQNSTIGATWPGLVRALALVLPATLVYGAALLIFEGDLRRIALRRLRRAGAA